MENVTRSNVSDRALHDTEIKKYDFWQQHGKEMRKTRLLQTAAILMAAPPSRDWGHYTLKGAVDTALNLEMEIEKHLSQGH